MKSLVLLILALPIFIGCQSRPVQDLALADVAIKAAQKAKADALAPDAYRKAENHYLRAKKDFNDGYYDSSKDYAKKARLLAEQAEYKALLKQASLKGPSAEEPAPGAGAPVGDAGGAPGGDQAPPPGADATPGQSQ